MLTLEPMWQPAAQQAQFRLLLEAMSRPGRCYTLVNIPQEGQVALAILVSLLDAEVLFSDPHHLLRDEDWPMLQARPASSEVADYILCDASVIPDFEPKLGTLVSPEKSATLVLVVNELGKGDMQIELTGPGVETTKTLAIRGLASEWLSMREEWNYAFPLGVDLILVDGSQVAALPRTTKVKAV